MHVLADPSYTVPPPGPPGPVGTMPWLRATVSRFTNGEPHARRRAIIEALLAELDPAELRAAAAAEASETRAVALPYLPVAVLAAATGVARRDAAEAAGCVRVVAAAYRPGTDAPGADDALARLLELLPGGEDEVRAQHVAVLVQACEPAAALVRGALDRPLDDVLRDDPPVRSTKRMGPDRRVVEVDLAGHPFGAGPRACPGAEHARALVEGVVEGARGAPLRTMARREGLA